MQPISSFVAEVSEDKRLSWLPAVTSARQAEEAYRQPVYHTHSKKLGITESPRTTEQQLKERRHSPATPARSSPAPVFGGYCRALKSNIAYQNFWARQYCLRGIQGSCNLAQICFEDSEAGPKMDVPKQSLQRPHPWTLPPLLCRWDRFLRRGSSCSHRRH